MKPGLDRMSQRINEIFANAPVTHKVAGDDFASKLMSFAEEIASIYRDGMDLSQEAVRISKREGLNENETKLLIHAINKRVYKLLFSKTRHGENRKVVFSIAKPEVVLSQLGFNQVSTPPELENNEEKVAAVPMTFEEKVASFTPREISRSSAPVPGAYQAYISEKTYANLKADLDQSEKIASDIHEDVQFLGRYLAKCASHKIDPQMVFSEICKKASLSLNTQVVIMDYYSRAADFEKISKKAALNCVDITEKSYSLGGLSISKIAEEQIATLPEVVDKKRQARTIENLVSIAQKIQNDDALLQAINDKIEAKKAILSSATANEKGVN